MSERSGVWFEGLVLGVIGYLTIAIFFAVVNLIGGQSPFLTAATLGRSLVGGPPEETIDVRAVAVYNALHAGVFVVIGVVVAGLVAETERHPQFWLLIFFVAVMGVMLMVPFFFLVAVPQASALPWWSVILANLLAAGAMGAYLARRHPGLREGIARQPDATV